MAGSSQAITESAARFITQASAIGSSMDATPSRLRVVAHGPARICIRFFFLKIRICVTVRHGPVSNRAKSTFSHWQSAAAKIWRNANRPLDPCNPLKSPKTAKKIFGKIWRKKGWIWKC
jgi:hypothetical protein